MILGVIVGVILGVIVILGVTLIVGVILGVIDILGSGGITFRRCIPALMILLIIFGNEKTISAIYGLKFKLIN